MKMQQKPGIIEQLAEQDLESHGPIAERDLLCQEHCAHAPSAQMPDHAIAPGEA
jgi:hypothetical protein